MAKKLVYANDVIELIHHYFMTKIEETETVIDEDGEHYIIKNVEPLLEHNKFLSKAIKELSDETPSVKEGE